MLSNLKDSVRDSIIYGLGSIAVKAAGFILIPLYTKHFPLSEYGILAILEATSLSFMAIFSLSLYQAFFVWYWDPKYANKQNRLFFTILLTVAFVSTIVVALTFFLKSSLSMVIFSNTKYHELILLLVIASSLQMIGVIPAKLMQLQRRAVLYTIANILMLIVNIAITVFLITMKGWGLEAIYMAQIIGAVVYLLFLSPFMLRNIEFRFEFTVLGSMIVYALPLVVASIAQIVIAVSDRYVLQRSSGYANLGLYSFGAKLANTIAVLVIAPIQMAINPMLVRIYNEGNYMRFFSKIMTYIALVVMMSILFFSFFGYEIVKVLAKRIEYWEAYKVIPILAFSALFVVMKDMGFLNLGLVKKTKIISAIVISISILNVGLNLLLIPSFGYMGAGISALSSQILYFACMHYFAHKYNYINYEYKKIFLLIFAGTILTIIALAINPVFAILRIAIKVIMLLSFPVLMAYLGFYEPVELLRLKEIWKKWRNHKKVVMNIKDFLN